MIILIKKFLLLLVLFSASVFAGNKTVIDGFLQIPMAGDQPTIDGNLDQIWKAVTATRMLVYEEGSDLVASYDDHYSEFRLMWDEDNLYLFVHIVDDTMDVSDAASPWFNDNIELFFDGNNGKTTSMEADDVQWRYVYGFTESDGGFNCGPGQVVYLDTDEGYNIEIAIPADSLTFDLEAGMEIGFEISNRDRDGGLVRNNTRWFGPAGDAYQNPSVYGEAVLSEREVSDILDIQYFDEEPDIDGAMTEGEGWDDVPEISQTVMENNDIPDLILTDWEDNHTSFKMFWNEDALYIFVTFIDDSADISDAASPWFNDNIELFFDGNNGKTTSMEADDIQWRYVYSMTESDGGFNAGPGDIAWMDTDEGYNLEIMIPADSLTFPLLTDHEIGFEISARDRDSGVAQINRRWFGPAGDAYQNPSVYGNAFLSGGDVTSIGGPEGNYAQSFILNQNFPNPFNPNTRIDYTIGKASFVNLSVYNLLGQKVATLVNGKKNAGNHFAVFDGLNLPSGIYFYKLEADDVITTKKMMLLK
jgi:hypothetical protein